MDPQQSQVVPKKKTFWRMVKAIFPPAQTIANLMVGCGGKRGKGKRRLSLKNMHLAKEAFLRSSLRRSNQSSGTRRIEVHREAVTNQNPNTTSGIIEESIENASIIATVESHNGYPQLESDCVSCDNAQPTPINLNEAQHLLETLALTEHPPINTCGSNESETYETEGQASSLTVTVEVERENCALAGNGFGETEISNLEQTQNNGNDELSPRCPPQSEIVDDAHVQNAVVARRTSSSSSVMTSSETDFHGWRRSSIEVNSTPPLTLAFIPSGLCVGDRVVWVKDEFPEIGTVRWIGKIRNQFYAGIEFDKPVGNSSGIYGYGVGMYKRLFTCQLSYGRFVPVKELVLYKDYHDTGVKSGIVCIICRDDFLDTWDPDSFSSSTHDVQECSSLSDTNALQAFHMVSTRCGHLYHFGCLDEWFSTKKRSDYHCPFCLTPMERTDVIRIFPSQI